MPNQYKNKVIYGDETLMDITDTTAESGDVIEGQVFYAKNGARSVGSLTDATQSTHGLMSTTDKIKLDNIIDGAGVVDVQIDSTEQAKLIAANIREGVTVLGVTGAMSGSEGVKATSVTVTPYTTLFLY